MADKRRPHRSRRRSRRHRSAPARHLDHLVGRPLADSPVHATRRDAGPQKAETFSRPPVTVLPVRDGVGTVLLRIAALMSAAEAVGCVEA
jgi:hypothetical protein